VRTTPTAAIDRFFQFSLLGLVTAGYFALAGSGAIDRATLILTFLGLILRAASIAGLIRLNISARATTIAATAYIALFAADFYFISRDFLTATIHFVCFLAVIKILTAQSNRDYNYTGIISFIELVAAALLSAHAAFIFLLALYLLFAIATFTSAEIRRGLQRTESGKSQPAPATRSQIAWRLGLVSAVSTFGILILTLGLFLLVPRTALMAATLFPGAPRITAFTNVVDLGGYGAIARDDRAVMHVHSDARKLPPDLHWRGAALSYFDGHRWFEPRTRDTELFAAPQAAVVADRLQLSRRDGFRMLYRVDLQNADTNMLFIAGIPEFINLESLGAAPRKILATPEGAFRIPGPPRETVRYQVSAHSGPRIPERLRPMERYRNLQFPPLDPRIPELALQWAQGATELDRALAIQRHLQRDFAYKLEDPATPPPDPLAYFLFVRKEGYCEYFASAMAVMLRTLGTPARVITGFHSGYFNDVNGLTVIRASDAHAWVEAWIDGHGWVTFDPTPSAPGGSTSAFMSRLNMYLDAANNTWNEWVVSYDLGHQVLLAARFEAALRSLSHPSSSTPRTWPARLTAAAKKWMPEAFSLGALIAGLIFFGPRLWRTWRETSHIRKITRTGGTPHDASILYERMLKHLAQRGYPKSPAATPAEFVQTLPSHESQQAAQITALYNVIRFGGDTSATPRLATLLKDFAAR
jgi:protein-glutamine gamma-glutamyltransferase